MKNSLILLTIFALTYLACGQEKSSSCFSKYKAMGQCFENIRNKSADWKNLSDKRKQIATECVAKNKKWQTCVTKWEEMKSCWQKSKVDPNVVAAETYLATVFDSCVAEYPLSPFAAVSPHKKMRRPHHGRPQHGHHHGRMEDKEMPGEEKSRSSEEKSKKSSSSEEGMKHSKEMMEKPRSDDMFSDDKFEKKPEFHSGMGHEEVSNIFDRVKRMTGGPHEAFDHEDFDFDRRHHGKHHRKSPCMGFMKCIWEGEKSLTKSDKTLVQSADAIAQAKMKCKTDNYVGYGCMASPYHFERCLHAPMLSLEMEIGKSIRGCLKLSEPESGENEGNSTVLLF